MTAPKRSWLRPTLFAIGVVIVCVIALRVYWMVQREDVFFNSMKRTGFGPVAAHRSHAPWSIRMFGARGYSSIGVAKNSEVPWTDADLDAIEEVRRLFPEAEVYAVSYQEYQAQTEQAEKDRKEGRFNPKAP